MRKLFLVERQLKYVNVFRETSAPLQILLETIFPGKTVLSHADFRSSLHTVCLAQLFIPVCSGKSALNESADIAEFLSVKLGEKSNDSNVIDGGEHLENFDKS